MRQGNRGPGKGKKFRNPVTRRRKLSAGSTTAFAPLAGSDLFPDERIVPLEQLITDLPALGNLTYYNQVDGPGYNFTDAELTMQVRNDFRDVLTQLYQGYQLIPLLEFAQSMGMGTRTKVQQFRTSQSRR